MKNFPIFKQHDVMDCGVSCVKMITDYNGQNYSFEKLKEVCVPTKEGVSLSSISNTLDQVGYNTVGGRLTVERLADKAPLPCILHWDQEHFVILYKINRKHSGYIFHIADPGIGLIKYPQSEFEKHWYSGKYDGEEKGVVLITEKKPDFEVSHIEQQSTSQSKFLLLSPYFLKYKKYFALLLVGLIVGSLIQLLFPFLTKSIVDIGIENKNIRFINIILIAQMVLLMSKMCSDFIQNWLLLHISTRVNVSMLSDFLMKMMKLPMRFFDSKLTGDIIQRFDDHKRLEQFITIQSVSVVYAFINFIIFGGVLLYFNTGIFTVFLIGSIFYIGWLILFMKRRKVLDYMMFEQRAINDSKTYQIIQGMQEIKLQGCTQRIRWEWEDVQAKLFDANIKLLKLQQAQKSGSVFINEIKNVLITFLAAYAVITGDLSIGIMIAIQFIIGQLGVPVEQIAQFIYNAQDTKISLDRIADIKNRDEENIGRPINMVETTDSLISIKNLTFAYDGNKNPILKNINIDIVPGQTIAIVGASGSGKTTLIKLLLQYYSTFNGNITIGGADINKIDTNYWRSCCGAVMQDGFIFSDTVARNIASSDDDIDLERLAYACEMSNTNEFVQKFPLKYNTIIGQEGRGLSQGQKQRILIARAIYKNPQFLFLDEATNSLDASNEKKITNKLESFMSGRTVFIVAHRLSTVKNADLIIALNNGEIVERGTHEELISNKGYYYNLIKNQLELGN